MPAAACNLHLQANLSFFCDKLHRPPVFIARYGIFFNKYIMKVSIFKYVKKAGFKTADKVLMIDAGKYAGCIGFKILIGNYDLIGVCPKEF